MRHAPSPTEGVDHRALSGAEAEEFLFSFLLFSYETKKKKLLYPLTKGYPQSIDVVYSDTTLINSMTLTYIIIDILIIIMSINVSGKHILSSTLRAYISTASASILLQLISKNVHN